jgi:hypothetical protein
MSCTVNRDPELILISALCRELAKLGLNVGLSDAQPAVVVRTGVKPPLWITVDASGEYFEWPEAESQPPVTDLSGAAALISELVKAQRSGPGEAS